MSNVEQNIKLRRLEDKILKLKAYNQKLKRELHKDELTGLFNVRSLKQRLENVLRKRRDSGQSPALLFIDVDHFKAVNEEHGHRTASRLLREVGAVIAKNVRDGDLAFRYGGDEFVVLVSGAESGANTAGERIRSAIERQCFEVKGLKGAQKIRLTVSVGIHVIQSDDTAASILDRADRALFQAKRLSRNKVVWNAA